MNSAFLRRWVFLLSFTCFKANGGILRRRESFTFVKKNTLKCELQAHKFCLKMLLPQIFSVFKLRSVFIVHNALWCVFIHYLFVYLLRPHSAAHSRMLSKLRHSSWSTFQAYYRHDPPCPTCLCFLFMAVSNEKCLSFMGLLKIQVNFFLL